MKRYLISILIAIWILPSDAQDLHEYFMIAAENNPGLQSKYKAFEAAMERIPQVNSLPDPTISFGYFISPVETRVGPQRARVSLSQMFPWFGTLTSGGDVAALEADALYQVFLDARNRLYYQVAIAYYPLYELARVIELEEANIEILKTYKAIATSKFENGEGDLVDVLRVDLMLKSAETDLTILRSNEVPLQSSFNKLLNRSETGEIWIPDTLSLEGTLLSRDSLLVENPVLEEMDLRIEASEARSVLAMKRGLPSIGIGVDYVLVGQRTDMVVEDNGKDVLMPMVSVGIPLFRRKYMAARNEALIMQESYELQKEDRINQLLAEYDMVEFEMNRQVELVQLYDSQIAETRQILDLLLLDYQNAGNEFEEVLRIQQKLLNYNKVRVSALTAYHKAIAKHNYITAKKY